MAPHFKKLLLEEDINKSDILVLSFDESLNQKTQSGQMDIIIRFWDNDAHCVQSRYLGSSFLGHAKSDNILEHVEKLTSDIDNTKVYQISMDGPNVNHKFYKELVKIRKSQMFHKMRDIGSCTLHIVSGSFKTGAEKSS